MNEYDRNRERTGKRDRRLEPILAHYLKDTGIAAYDLGKYGFAAQLPYLPALIWFGHVDTELPDQLQKYLDDLDIMQVVYIGEGRVNWKINGQVKQYHIGAIDKYFAQFARPLAALQFNPAESDIHLAWSGYLRNVGQSVYDLDMLILREGQPALWVETKYTSAPDQPHQFGWAGKKYEAKNVVIEYQLERNNFASLDDLPWAERVVQLTIGTEPVSCRWGIDAAKLQTMLIRL